MRVAIVRLSSLGDVVHTLPLAHALRQGVLPVPYVVWIVEEREQSLLLDNPAVDEVVVAPTRRWRRELRARGGTARVLREFRALGRRLQALRLDVAIDVQGLLKSAIFTVMTRARMRIGFSRRQARDPLSCLVTTHRVSPPPGLHHIVDQNLSLLEPLGIAPGEVVFPLPAPLEAERRVDVLLAHHRVTSSERLLALLPATRRPEKQWAPERYLELAKELEKDRGVRLLLLAGPGEEDLVDFIAGQLDGRGVPLPATSIPEMAAVLRRAHLAIGGDTGPIHLAAALGLPTIGLYGPTSPERNGPYGGQGHTIRSPTRRMPDIAVDTVVQAAKALLR